MLLVFSYLASWYGLYASIDSAKGLFSFRKLRVLLHCVLLLRNDCILSSISKLRLVSSNLVS